MPLILDKLHPRASWINSSVILAASRLAGYSTIQTRRGVQDFVRGATPDGHTYKVPLRAPKIVGVQSSRGERAYQEDATAVCAIQLNPLELKQSLPSKLDVEWEPSKTGIPAIAGQVSLFCIFDGHGGRSVSAYLKDNLASTIESVTPAEIAGVVDETVALGGYFRRWRGGQLRRWTEWTLGERADPEKDLMTLDERLTLAFLKADQELRRTTEGEAWHTGSTASVVLIHSIDEPGQPHFSAKKLHLTVAHVGDTRVLLCDRRTGEVVPLTNRHHAEAHVEASRLRRMGTDRLISDSFGETRWMGAIENTRGFGDFEFKSSGVTAEPEITRRILSGDDSSYLVLVTDGLTSLLSDQELVDLARNSFDPGRAAKTIVEFGEDLGARDNCTCIVVPLAGWGDVGGLDTTEARREYRRQQAGELNTRMQRM